MPYRNDDPELGRVFDRQLEEPGDIPKRRAYQVTIIRYYSGGFYSQQEAERYFKRKDQDFDDESIQSVDVGEWKDD
jgi:hypothetical protein